MAIKGDIIDRTGEKGINKFGSEMIISKYRGARDIDVYFPKYNWYIYNRQYDGFQKGTIKCPYEPRAYGVGYLGEGKYKTKENGKHTKYHRTWMNMLMRCYDNEYQEKHPSYKGCYVEDYMLNFQNAAEFFDSIYYEVPGEIMCLDKDILKHGNKIYSRETCIFVPQRINTLFTKRQNDRGKYPIGITPNGNGYQVSCSNGGKYSKYLGTYKTKDEAFQVYKQYKENVIKYIADEYKEYIPKEIYYALYEYDVRIDD